jgi:D5 N terminal like
MTANSWYPTPEELAAAQKPMPTAADRTAAWEQEFSNPASDWHSNRIADNFTGSDTPPISAQDSNDQSRTDDGNALRLVNTHGHEIRRVADMRRWHHWDGQRWVKDDEGRTVRQHARELARQLPEKGPASTPPKTLRSGVPSPFRTADH